MNFKKIAHLTISLSLISSFNAFSSSQNPEEFKGNWTKIFRLKNGENIIHTPEKVRLGFINCYHLRLEDSQYNEMPLKAPLDLHVNSTIEEFIKAIEESGLPLLDDESKGP